MSEHLTPDGLDPLERRVRDSLHARPAPEIADVAGTRGVFLERRKRRERKRRLLALAASGSTAFTITLVAMLLGAFGGGGTGGQPSDRLGVLSDGTTGSLDPSATPTPSPSYDEDGNVVMNTDLPDATKSGGTSSGGGQGSASPGTATASGTIGGNHPSAVVSSSPEPTAVSSGDPSPSPYASCSSAGNVRAGESSGCYVIHVGESFTVNFAHKWSEAESDNGTALPRTRSQASSAEAEGYSVFSAVAEGDAVVSSYHDPCGDQPPDQPMCGAPVQLWSVTVHVIP